MKTEKVLKKNAIKAYKAFNSDLTCKGFQYEVGKEYRHKGKLEVCRSGFHACFKPIDCFKYYRFSAKETRVAEVLVWGSLEYDNSNSDLTWIEEAEPLGRESSNNFPGWMRAFAHAMFVSLNYDYCCHIKNDARILNVPEVCSWMYIKGTYAFHDLHYNTIESAIMCLNDVDVRRAYATVFSQHEMQHSDTMFETQLENLIDSPVSILKSYRLEGRQPETLRGKGLDALCQVGTDYD